MASTATSVLGGLSLRWVAARGKWRWEGGLDPRIKMTIKPHVGAAERESDAVALVEAHYESCLRLNGLTKGRAIQFSWSDVQEGQ